MQVFPFGLVENYTQDIDYLANINEILQFLAGSLLRYVSIYFNLIQLNLREVCRFVCLFVCLFGFLLIQFGLLQFVQMIFTYLFMFPPIQSNAIHSCYLVK